MRKAKVAATIFGGVSSVIFGGLFAMYATAPVVSPITPKKCVEQISDSVSDPASDVMISTTTATTAVTTAINTSTTTTKAIFTASYTTASDAAYNVVTTASIVQLGGEVNAVDAWAPVNNEVQTTTAAEVYTEPTEQAAEVPVYQYEVPEEIDFADAPEEIVYEEVKEEPTSIEPVAEPTPAPEPEVKIPEEVTEEAPAAPVEEASALPISESDYIILCNAVAHEAGCYWIDINDKAKVVEVIMNRVNSPLYPNSITGVLTQPYQFSNSSGYVYLGTYSSSVTDSVKQAVDLYFADPSAFAHGYFSFYGDGTHNYFS